MSSCCWYHESTCCTVMSGFLPEITNVTRNIYNNITSNGTNTSEELSTW